MTLLATAPPKRIARIEPTRGEQRWSLGAVGWETYKTISEALTGRHVRLTYDRGRLEFMTISSKHGRLSRLIAQLVAAIADEMGVPRAQYGDMTCDNPEALRGLEPDECFYLENEPRVRGKEEIDLSTDLLLGLELSDTRSDPPARPKPRQS